MKTPLLRRHAARLALLGALASTLVAACGGGGGYGGRGGGNPPPAGARFAGPASSQPLAADNAYLVVANEDNNSITFFDVRGDANRQLAEVPVQSEPGGVAFLPDGSKANAANAVSGTVSVIPVNTAAGTVGARSCSRPTAAGCTWPPRARTR